MSGATNLVEASIQPLEIPEGLAALYNVNVKYHESYTHCHDGQRSLSLCVRRYLDEKYPQCVSKDQDYLHDHDHQEDCSLEDLMCRWGEQETLRLEGYEYLRLENQTG